MRFNLILLLYSLFFSSSLLTFAQNNNLGNERIVLFNSDIEVHEDSTMLVTETITVVALNQQINHGIYRDFPTRYSDRYGNDYRVAFKIKSITRDGYPEKYHTEALGNGVRIYIGDANITVPTGEHKYAITYATDRQLGFFKDHDELYWNVTGNGWVFPINKATATVTLPAKIPREAVKVEGYTGPQGGRGQAYTAYIAEDGKAYFATTQPLNAYEGLTIVVSFPTGYITRPTQTDKLAWLLKDNIGFIFCIIGFLAITGFYLYAWNKVGRDPKSGVIIPQFTPPEGFSPAALRYILKMKYDHKAFAATIINAAVHGELTIIETKKGLFGSGGQYAVQKVDNIEKKTNSRELAEEESILLDRLFNQLGDTVNFSNNNYRQIQAAITSFQGRLKSRYNKKYFSLNSSYMTVGILVSIALMVLVFFFSARSISGFQPILLIPGILFIFLHIIFSHLLKAPTTLGRKLMDDIEGFKLYLEVAEKDELNFRNPPQKTPELFEELLPYALALDVEQAWSQKFASVLDRVSDTGERYHPTWYYGHSWTSLGAAGFASSFSNSFSSAISSSSTAPGSSSGSGGGGSSGGGGGGGGGGGW